MVPVDFRPGYGYDIAADLVANGADVNEQQYYVGVQVSLDGVIWVTLVSAGRYVKSYNILADGRVHGILAPGAYPNWKFARVVVQNSDPVASPTPTLTSLPTFCTLVIQEFTTA
jgi:hypothetical protein